MKMAMKASSLSQHFLSMHPRESAKVLEEYEAAELIQYFENIPDPVVANIIRYFLTDNAVACLAGLEQVRAARLLELMGVDAAARILRNMHNSLRMSLLGAVSSGFSHRVRTILRYPNGTVGQYMSPNIFIATDDMMPGRIIEEARSASSELLGDIFIVDESQRLAGVVDIKTLVFAEQDQEVKKIMRRPSAVLNARANLDYVKDNPKWQWHEALPVVDHNNLFVGILKRKVMHEAISSGQEKEQKDESAMETVMEVAELFWDICAGLIAPKAEVSREGQKNDRKQ